VRILPALFVAAAFALAAPAAHANMTAVFTGSSGTTYNYTLRFTADQPGEQLRPGDFLTVYDFPVVTTATAPVGFSVTLANTGTTPAGFGPPAVVDNAALINVTFTYTGSTRTASTDFTGAVVTTNANFTGTAFGRAAGTTSFLATADQGSTNITVVPTATGSNIPEPASLGLLSLGALALLARRRA
jgi:hypothetical protein